MQALRGFNDFFGIEAKKFNYIIEVAKNISQKYGFQSLILPILEKSLLFERNLGNDTDIVSKEIYKFEDKSGDIVAMRPEFTAGVVRALCEHGSLRNEKLPLKFFSHGPLFRYERPQSGRYRQFNQINFEIFGQNGLDLDFLIIQICHDIVTELKIENTQCEVNFIGGIECKSQYINYLNEYFTKYKNDLSEQSRARLEIKKSLRILDSKDENDKKLCCDIKRITAFYSTETQNRINKFKELCGQMNINIVENSNLVRGLDYYTDLVFEITSFDLQSKSQKAILGGGRYDNLVSDISNKRINLPAVGFASGVERLMQLIEMPILLQEKIIIIPMTDEFLAQSFIMQQKIFNKFKNSIVEISAGNSAISKRINRANELDADYIMIVGEDEVKENKYILKSLKQQQNINF